MKTTNIGALVLSAVIGCSKPLPETSLQTTTIYNVDAVRIHEGNPDNLSRTQFANVNYAGQPVIVGNSAEDGFSEALIGFSLDLLEGKQVESAQLYVTVGQTAMSSYDNTVCDLKLPLEIRPKGSSWDPKTVTWSTGHYYSPHILTTADVSVPCGETRTYIFDISDFVINHIDAPQYNNGIVILSQDDTENFRQEQRARHGGNYQIGRAVQVDAVLSDFKVEVDYR